MIEQITQDLKAAMKLQDKPKILGLRNLLGKLKAQQIDKGEQLSDPECIKILNSAAKQLKDSIEQYSNANRLDLIEKEKYESAVTTNKGISTDLQKDRFYLKRIRISGKDNLSQFKTKIKTGEKK